MAKDKAKADDKSKPDDKAKEADGKASSGSGKKLLIIGLAAGLLAGGGIAAAYFLFLAPQKKVVAAVETPPPPPAPENTTFVKVDRVSAPLVHEGQVLGYVLLDLSLEVKGNANELLVAQRLPALKAAFLKEVTRAPIGKEGEPLIIDFDALTNRLRQAANQELGKAAILRVLVTQSTRV
ncbi:MAG: hypothetical protein DCC73_10940 [Proteobacteria bacterium]|jgi:flagellar basal body-associated protein FliL|nr:MAG: hypothetical protein DCC73_10940 [Pseudomonadota bacterium]